MRLSQRAKDRLITTLAVCGSLALVIWIALTPPRHPTGSGVAHVGITKNELPESCLVNAVVELDAGILDVSPARKLVLRTTALVIRTDAEINYAGQATHLRVTQSEGDDGWHLSAGVRTSRLVTPAEDNRIYVEDVTRRTVTHLLTRCASEGDWDGGVECMKWGARFGEKCHLAP